MVAAGRRDSENDSVPDQLLTETGAQQGLCSGVVMIASPHEEPGDGDLSCDHHTSAEIG